MLKRYDSSFLDIVGNFNFEALEKSKYSIYALSKDLKFIYFNPAWYKFAKKNGFDKAVAKKTVLGSSFIKALHGVRLRLYFYNHYKKAIRTGKVWHHEYECSSKKKYRFFHQTAYPLPNKNGLLIIHAEMFKLPMGNMNRENFHAIEHRYLNADGQIVQCSNCRHTQRADQPEIWDWVSDWVKKLPANHRLTICPTCEHLYND